MKESLRTVHAYKNVSATGGGFPVVGEGATNSIRIEIDRDCLLYGGTFSSCGRANGTGGTDTNFLSYLNVAIDPVYVPRTATLNQYTFSESTYSLFTVVIGGQANTGAVLNRRNQQPPSVTFWLPKQARKALNKGDFIIIGTGFDASIAGNIPFVGLLCSLFVSYYTEQ